MHCTLTKCWHECLEKADYRQKLKLVQKFNQDNRWKKRGVAVVPSTYGVSFNIPFLNQGAALVQV